MDPVPTNDSKQRRIRIAIVGLSCVVAIAGAVLLATRDSSEGTTTEGVSATLQVPSHPGWLAAGSDALWLALNRDRESPIADKALLRLELATGVIEQTVSVGGEASYLTRVGNRLIASVRHLGQDEFGGRHVLALDWLTGDLLVRRSFEGPVDHIVHSDNALWALEVRPGRLFRLDPRTLTPTAPPLRLSPGRAPGLAAGGGYIWVTASDAGELLRIDPATRAITRVDVGGSPMGVVVAGGSVWYTDAESGEVAHRNARTLQPLGEPIDVGPNPTWLAAAGDSLLVADAQGGTVRRIDLRLGEAIGPPIRIAPPAESATFALSSVPNGVWVSSFASNTVTRIAAAPSANPQRTVVVGGGEATGGAGGLPRGAKVVATIAVPSGGAFAAGEGAVWTMSNVESTLTRIDPQTNAAVARIEMSAPGEDAVVAEGSVWVSHLVEDAVVRIDPATNRVTETISVGPQPAGVAASSGAVWVANIGGPTVSRIDPGTNRVVATIRVGPLRACCTEHMAIVASDDAVWVSVSNLNALVRIDPATNSVTNTVKVSNVLCGVLAMDESTVWYTSAGCGDRITRLDARTGRLVATLEGDPHPIGVAVAFGSVWIAALGAASIDRIDPETARVVARMPVGGLPVRLAVGFGSIWVSDDEGGRVLRIEPQD